MNEKTGQNGPLVVRAASIAGPYQFLQRESDLRFFPDMSFLRDVGSWEQTINLGTYLGAFEEMEKASYQGAFLVRASLQQDVRDLGLAGKAIVHAETLWEALQTIRVGLSYFVSAAELVITMRYGRCRVEYKHAFPDSLGANLDVQYTIGAIYNVITHAAWTPSANMTVTMPGAVSDHASLFPLARHVLSSRFGALEFDDVLLRSPMKLSDPGYAAIARSVIEGAAADPENHADVSALVGDLLASSIREAQMPATLAQAGYLLGLPSRTLQDHLKRRGTSFAELRAQARHTAAREALSRGHTIGETAMMVGYAQRQTFSEAFTMWEGVSPSEYASRGRLV